MHFCSSLGMRLVDDVTYNRLLEATLKGQIVPYSHIAVERRVHDIQSNYMFCVEKHYNMVKGRTETLLQVMVG